MATFPIRRYPEWKALYDAVLPRLAEGETTFTYELLNELAHLNLTTPRGRGQFYRFRKELLRTHQVWLQNIPGVGYMIIPAKEQPKAAFKQVRSAKKKVRMAQAINTFVRYEDLTSEQRALQAGTAALLHSLATSFTSIARKFHVASKQAEVVGTDLPKLLESIKETPKKPLKKISN